MTAYVSRLDLRLRRRSLLGYALGMGSYTLGIVALYPSFKNDTSLDKFTADAPTAAALFGTTGSLTSPAGWLGVNIYANFLPLVVLILTIGYGASCIAGQDEDGTLGLVAALPMSRRRLLMQKFTTLVLLALPVTLVTMLAVLAGRDFGLSVDISNLVGVTVGVWMLGIDFGALAMLIGAVRGSRGTALGVTSAVAAASYVVSSLAPVTGWLHPLRFGSLFFWAVGDGQLVNGLSAPFILVLTAVGALLVATAVVAFDRLDLH